MKTDDVKIESKIYDDDGFPMLQILVEGYVYKFTLAPVDEGSQEWLKDILVRMFSELYAQGYNRSQEDVRGKFGEFIQSFGQIL
jgi:hypothetical protein